MTHAKKSVLIGAAAIFAAKVWSAVNGVAEPEARLQSDKPIAQVSIVRAARSLYQIVRRLPKRFTATLDFKGRMEARRVAASCAGGQHSTCAGDPRCDCEWYRGPPTRVV
jgi:hypothetical protein